MEVCVRGGGGFQQHRSGAALWLRVIAPRSQHQSPAELSSTQEHVVFENKIADAERVAGKHGAGPTWRSKSAHVKLSAASAARRHVGGKDECVFSFLTLELWAAEAIRDVNSGDDADAFLSFVGSGLVDLKQWREASSATATRWYALKWNRTPTKEAWGATKSSAFEEHEERLLPDAVYFEVTLPDLSLALKEAKCKAALETRADVKASSSSSSSTSADFQFSPPSQSITQNRRFLTTRVGEIVNEGNTEYLRELLPSILYGKAQLSTAPSQLRINSQQARDRCCLNSGLQLLQLSCQYACYCATKLDESTRLNVEIRRTQLHKHKVSLQTRRRKIELQRRNLRRELQVLDSALDGMRVLLQQVEPECLARLTDAHQKSAQ